MKKLGQDVEFAAAPLELTHVSGDACAVENMVETKASVSDGVEGGRCQSPQDDVGLVGATALSPFS